MMFVVSNIMNEHLKRKKMLVLQMLHQEIARNIKTSQILKECFRCYFPFLEYIHFIFYLKNCNSFWRLLKCV